MRLGELLSVVEHSLRGDGYVEVTGLGYDSRRVLPGWAFFCIRGFRHDGHAFVAQAIENGASLIVAEEPVDTAGRPLALVSDTRRSMAHIASHFHGHPSKHLRIIGITGTNGKTTTTHLVRWILTRAGHPTDLVGTVINTVGGREVPVERTTPESVDLMGLFDEMRRKGSTHVVMEVSSHALELDRVSGCEFDVGVLTNLTQDHLDFHNDLACYRVSKGRLFRDLGGTYQGTPKQGPKVAIINADDPSFHYFSEICAVPVVSYGISSEADFWAREVAVGHQGVGFALCFPGGEVKVTMPATGRFNVYNALAAAAVARLEGVEIELLRECLETFPGVAGRFQVVSGEGDPTVIVDYAHTPDGLKNVLETAREITAGGLCVVFGCGGDRDKTKRPLMGEIAARLADSVVVTSDNPRSEDPLEIAAAVEEGVRRVRESGYDVIVDRRFAIRDAVRRAGVGDVIVIAGKGHETDQIFGDRTVPFDDAEVARQALRERRNIH